MSTREALLNAIIESPDDDAVRLVYADFLQETSDRADAARAELIRVEIARHQLPPGHPEKSGLLQQALALVKKHRLEWFPFVKSSDSIPLRLDRGFASKWFFRVPTLFAEGPELFAREPITEITLSANQRGELSTAAGCPLLARVRTLNLWPGEVDGAELEEFFASPHLTELRELWFMGRFGTRAPIAGAVRMLATDPKFARLRSIVIQNAGVGDAGAIALAGSTTLLGVAKLGLGQCDIGRDGLRAVVDSSFVEPVTHLILGGNARTAADGEALAAALAVSPHLVRLESLWLDETAFTDRAAERLAAAVQPVFKALEISPNHRQHTDQPTGLATMTAAGVESLCAAPFAGTLESLTLSGHPFGDAGAAALARGNRLGRLTQLELMQTGITAVGLRALVGAYSQQLKQVQMARCPLGDDGAAAIAEAPWPRMTAPQEDDSPDVGLFLGGCGIGDRGAQALADSSTIPGDIPFLFLGQGSFSPRVEAALRQKYPKATIRF